MTRVFINHSSFLRVQMYNSFLNLQYFLKINLDFKDRWFCLTF